MTNPKWLSFVERLTGGLIGLALLTLPITGLPLLARLMGGTLVAPPSLIFAALTALVWIPVLFLRLAHWPREVIPLLWFVAVTLIVTLGSVFIPLPPYKDASAFAESFSAFITLGMGGIIFLTFAVWPRRTTQLDYVLRLFSLGGLIMLAWSLVQVYFFYAKDGAFPDWAINLHGHISLRPLTLLAYMHRSVGFSYEPSWLAHMLNVLYIPVWLGATLADYSAFWWRIWRISVENVLLVLSVFILITTESRIGLLSFFMAAAYLLLRFNLRIARWLQGRLRLLSKLPALVVSLGLFGLYALVAVALVYGLSFIDHRLAGIFSMQKLPSDPYALSRNLSMGERLAYWMVGWGVFTHYPVFGVGLGHSGFFFSQFLPEPGRILVEILKVDYELAFVSNVKNLWIRLLSETGLVGFAVFAGWLFALWQTARSLTARSDALARALGWMGLLAIVGLIGEGFSIDSFALPYYWTAFGLLSAAGFMFRNTNNKNILEKEV